RPEGRVILARGAIHGPEVPVLPANRVPPLPRAPGHQRARQDDQERREKRQPGAPAVGERPWAPTPPRPACHRKPDHDPGRSEEMDPAVRQEPEIERLVQKVDSGDRALRIRGRRGYVEAELPLAEQAARVLEVEDVPPGTHGGQPCDRTD